MNTRKQSILEKKYDTRSVEDINNEYTGKSLGEIIELEDARTDAMRQEVDADHDAAIADERAKMLTVQKLIDYLKTQDPGACILAYEDNSFAYIEQWPVLPNPGICTVKEHKARMRESLASWYKGTDGASEKIEHDISKAYRYAKDNDVIIEL